jgi:YHS domain-containing protein
MRVIVILILIVIAIGLARMLVGDVVKAVGKTMKSPSDAPPDPRGSSATGRLVKDPETGHYIDERTALKAEVKGTTYYFESAASREAFLRRQRS